MYAFNKKLTAGIVGMGNDNTKEKEEKHCNLCGNLQQNYFFFPPKKAVLVSMTNFSGHDYWLEINFCRSPLFNLDLDWIN